jgi:hypothetical protein
MPGMDGTGPLGMGPQTGWGRGPCAVGYGERPAAYGGWTAARGPGFGRGRGWGRGLGRKFRWGFPTPGQSGGAGIRGTPWGSGAGGDEAAWLTRRSDALKAELDAVKRRLDELATEAEG